MGRAVEVVMVIMTSDGFPTVDPRSLSTGEIIFRCVDEVLELWHVSQAISSLVPNDEPPLSLDDAIDSLNVQLSAHGHLTQVKEPNYKALRQCFA